MDDEDATGLIRMAASAPGYACDVCGSRTAVCHVAIPESRRNIETGFWIDLLTWHDCYLCGFCAQPDGGLVSVVCRDGWVVYQLSSRSKFGPGRIVWVPPQSIKQ